jgi:hypothetical protein
LIENENDFSGYEIENRFQSKHRVRAEGIFVKEEFVKETKAKATAEKLDRLHRARMNLSNLLFLIFKLF